MDYAIIRTVRLLLTEAGIQAVKDIEKPRPTGAGVLLIKKLH